MKKFFTVMTLLGALVLVGCGNKVKQPKPHFRKDDLSGEVVPGVSLTGNFYVNEEYGFSLHFPKEAVVTQQFSTFYHLPPSRMAAPGASKGGTPLISIVMNRLENKNSYPLYFDAETRVGVSTDPGEVAHCTGGLTDQDISGSTITINDIPFTVYTIQDAAMMQYIEGLSYRTVHNNTCYVIEQLKTGSSYHNEEKASDIPQSTLDNYYIGLNSVIQSFSFIK